MNGPQLLASNGIRSRLELVWLRRKMRDAFGPVVGLKTLGRINELRGGRVDAEKECVE